MGLDDLDGTTKEQKYDTYSRFHKVVLSLAVVSTEVFFVSSNVYDKQLKRIQEITQSGMNVSPGTSPNLRSFGR